MQTLLVGGAVRDLLMGVPSYDKDYVVIGATHEDMIAAGYKQVGADFPVYLDADGTEYALARTERKNGTGYNGFDTDASPTVTLVDDLNRRDLTINAMAQDTDGSIVDPFGGQSDLGMKVLRHVSEAFAEDPVRVLRLARFHARFGPEWKVAESTLQLCQEMVQRGELNHLTRERVLKELEKALSEPHPHLFFNTLSDCGAFKSIFPDLWQHTSWAFNPNASTPLNYCRLAMFAASSEKFADSLNVCTHWRQYERMYSTMAFCPHYDKIDVLYDAGAFRNQALCEEILQDSERIDSMMLTGFREAFDATKSLGFSDLSMEQHETLRGEAIGEAIKQLRKQVYQYKAKSDEQEV